MHWPTTVEEVAALPAAYGAHVQRLEQLLRFAGDSPERRPQIIAAYIAHRYNGFYIPAVFNLWLWRAVGSVMVLSLVWRYILPPIHRVPRQFRKIYTTVESALTLAPLYGTSSSEPRRLLSAESSYSAWTTYQVPLLLDGVLLAIYLSASFYFTFFHYTLLEPNIFFPSLQTQYLRYLSDRTALLSFGSTPLLILLAARNSPLTYLTGASFARLQVWHRWVSRVTFGAVGVHAAGYTVLILQPPSRGVGALWEKGYLKAGWAAFLGGCILCFASWRRLREISYEIFLLGHILGALLWLLGAYYHVGLLHGQRSHLWWIYLAVSFWAGERVLRLLSLLINNTPLRFLPFPSFSLIKRNPSTISLESAPLLPSPNKSLAEPPIRGFALASATLLPSGEFLRLRIRPARPWNSSRGRPGSYVFISLPSLRGRGWESHPFSIAWPLGMPLPLPLPRDGGGGFSSSSSSLTLAGESSEDEQEGEVVAGEEEIELVVRRCEGFTSRLCEAVAGEGDLEGGVRGWKELRIMVEGPYGVVHSFEKERWVLLVAGGSGVAGTVSHLADMAKHAQAGTLETERVVVVWSVRSVDTVALLLPYLHRLRSLLPSSFLDLHIYLTRPPSISPSALSKPITTSSILSPLLSSPSNPNPFLTLSTHLGRPHLGRHVDRLLEEGKGEGGRVAISACGPAGLCDRAREAVRERIGGEGGVTGERLCYREEGGTW